MFEGLVSRWIVGRLEEPCLELWDTFRQSAEDALLLIRESQGRGIRVAEFISDGPIGVAVQTCLRSPVMAELKVNWRVRNTSLTTFLFSGPRVSLDGFNELPHLSLTPEMISFR